MSLMKEFNKMSKHWKKNQGRRFFAKDESESDIRVYNYDKKFVLLKKYTGLKNLNNR